MWVKYLLMQRQQQTVELRFQHPAPHAERRIEHLAQTLRRGRRGKKRETEHPHSQITHTHRRYGQFTDGQRLMVPFGKTNYPIYKADINSLFVPTLLIM